MKDRKVLNSVEQMNSKNQEYKERTMDLLLLGYYTRLLCSFFQATKEKIIRSKINLTPLFYPSIPTCRQTMATKKK